MKTFKYLNKIFGYIKMSRKFGGPIEDIEDIVINKHLDNDEINDIINKLNKLKSNRKITLKEKHYLKDVL
jgi:hypothetical protein